MTEDEKLRDLIELVEKADLVILCFGEKKGGLGPDMQGAIVSAMKIAREVLNERATEPPRPAA